MSVQWCPRYTRQEKKVYKTCFAFKTNLNKELHMWFVHCTIVHPIVLVYHILEVTDFIISRSIFIHRMEKENKHSFAFFFPPSVPGNLSFENESHWAECKMEKIVSLHQQRKPLAKASLITSTNWFQVFS